MELHSKKFVLAAIGAVLALGVACNSSSPAPPVLPAANTPAARPALPAYNIPLQVGAQELLVQIADTDALREQGLSGRVSLSDNQGMLFDFRNTAETMPGFWMKEMKFNLDLIWINRGKIIAVTPGVPAPKTSNDFLPTYYPPSATDMVLEVNGGWAAAHGIKVGDGVKLK